METGIQVQSMKLLKDISLINIQGVPTSSYKFQKSRNDRKTKKKITFHARIFKNIKKDMLSLF